MMAGNLPGRAGFATYPWALDPSASSVNMLSSTSGNSDWTGVRAGLMGTLAWAASLPSQKASKSFGRGVERPSFWGATAAPIAYRPLLRPVLPPTNAGVSFAPDFDAEETPSRDGT